MNNPPSPHEDTLANASREEIMAALFANMVIQQTNMAMMFLGKTPHPETGQVIHDLEAARMFIDQLEMLEAKTKGNLSRQEEGLLKQALAALHMSFVETIDSSGGKSSSSPEPSGPAPASAEPAPQPSAAPSTAEPAPVAEESRKKFTKKY